MGLQLIAMPPNTLQRRIHQLFNPPWKRTIYILFLTQVMSAVGFASIFPFLPLYVKELGSSTGLSIELLSGLVFSGQAFTMMLAAPFWGAMADRYGRKLMVERAMFGGSIVLLLMAFARSAEELILLRMLQGVITGTVAAANALAAAAAPREQTGYAMGMLQVGLGAGVALGPLIGGAVADLWGYYAAFYVTAAMLFLSGVLAWVGIQETFTPQERGPAKKGGFWKEWGATLAVPGIGVAYALRFLSQLGQMILVPVIPLFVQTLMISSERVNTFTGLVVGVTSLTTTLSAVYLGRLGDRLGQSSGRSQSSGRGQGSGRGHRQVVIVSSLAAALLYLPQALANQGWQLLLFQALVGVAMGGIIPTTAALLANYTRPGKEGAVYGLDNSVVSGARSLAPLVGAGVAAWFGLKSTFLAAAVVFLISGLLAAGRLPQGSKEALTKPGSMLK